MKTKTLDGDKPIIFLGDHHGSWHDIFELLNVKQIENCNLISVGDLGIGFQYKKEYEYEACEELNLKFKEKNINFYGIRGNHDDPYFFSGKSRINLSNFELIEDYTIAEYTNKTIQFIGGAISVDRVGRKIGVSYWENEGIIFNRESCQKVDILVTHTAPSFCAPQAFGKIVYDWAREDAYLIEDLNDERAVIDEIFKLCDPEYHFYGHFHFSWSEKINKCTHRLLNINEFLEYKI